MRERVCVLLVGMASCYRPRVEGACHTRCDPAIGACPGELACMADGLCHDPDDPVCRDDPFGDGGTLPFANNLMFVTSKAYKVGMLGSAEAGDAKCMEAAREAGLGGTYRAYLATTTASATDRLNNARGWVRRDGRPFADSIADIIAGRILYPPRIDELGVDRGNNSIAVGTGAAADSALLLNCDDYTATLQTTNMVTAGRVDAGTDGWTQETSVGCGSTVHLYCFGIDRIAPLVVTPAQGKHAFVTLGTLKGSAGRGNFDGMCNTEAALANLTGDYVALVSTVAESAATHATHTGPWVRKDGVSIGTLDDVQAPLNVTATGDYRIGAVWTGADAPDKLATNATSCTSWTVAGNGLAGDLRRSSVAGFYNAGTGNCDQPLPIRCVEQ